MYNAVGLEDAKFRRRLSKDVKSTNSVQTILLYKALGLEDANYKALGLEGALNQIWRQNRIA